jgi:hypothetical protein
LAAFSDMVGLLDSLGIFNYLALLLVFLVLYFTFGHLLGKRERPRKKIHRDLISFVLAILITFLIYWFALPFAGAGASYVLVAVFAVAVIFLILAVIGKMAGIDLPELLGKKD